MQFIFAIFLGSVAFRRGRNKLVSLCLDGFQGKDAKTRGRKRINGRLGVKISASFPSSLFPWPAEDVSYK